jgi:hypothetical protein
LIDQIEEMYDEIKEALAQHGPTYLVSKALGFGMALGACFYKLPIIINAVKAGHCGGLSPLAFYLETSSFMANIYYNVRKDNPFSTYADLIAVGAQLVLLILMMWTLGLNEKKERLPISHISAVIGLFAILIYVIFNYIDEAALSYLMLYAIVVSLLSKVPQIIKNFQTKNTGVQSVITGVNSIAGPLVKVYIMLVETKDMFSLFFYVMSFVLNAVILSQIIAYGNGNKSHSPVEAKSKKTQEMKHD